MALRTAHIGVTSVLFGGHVFKESKENLLLWLYLTIATGGILAAIEAYPRLRWFYQGRGAAVMGKLLLLCLILIPWVWDHRVVRVGILVAVIVIASVGSHMPARYRYYSFVHGRVLD